MPLPLAHPAAVLPLRRFCPRYFDFSALMIGSLAPDFAYVADYVCNFSGTLRWMLGSRSETLEMVANKWDWDDLSHTFVGGTLFCLPAGWLVLGVVRALRAPLVETLPNPHRQALLPLCASPRMSEWTTTASLLVGSWTHIVWDSFTNSDHWLARHWTVLRWPVLELGGQQLLMYRCLWLVSSAAGPLILGFLYLRFLKRSGQPLWVWNERERRHYALWLGLAMVSVIVALPVTVHFKDEGASVYNFTHQWVGLIIAVFCGGGLLIGVTSKWLKARFFLS